jgi:hypothetical protein
MDTIKFSCVIGSTNITVPLGMEIWLDDEKLLDLDHVYQTHQVEYEMPDNDGDHELRFVLKNKLSDHTQVDSYGNIVSDATVMVSDIQFDDIDCQYLTVKLARYYHDFNGNGEPTLGKFYGEMGCNGTASLRFTTPIYLWLLENM